MGRAVDGIKRLVRAGLTPESLPEPPPEPTRSAPRQSAFRTLLGSESLPEAPAGTRRTRTSILTLLLGREDLPFEPAVPRSRRPWIATLFATERLDPPGDPGPEVR
jgi:hypothetical protein